MTAPVWNEERVQRWLAKVDALEAQLEPVSDTLFATAGLAPGMAVLDVGCGSGSTTRRAYDLVSPTGTVTGLDIAPGMIDAARRLSGDRTIRWLTADLVDVSLPAMAFDVVISRFGVMFFSDPAAAFTRLARATRPGGRLCLAVWRAPGDTPLFDIPYAAVVQALRAADISTASPPDLGTGSLADPDRTRDLLGGAGWSSIVFETHDDPLYLHGPASLDQVVGGVLEQGPLRLLLEGQPPAVLDLARAALRTELAPLHDGSGVPLPGGFAVITASRA